MNNSGIHRDQNLNQNPNQRTLLDLYPSEILDKILSYTTLESCITTFISTPQGQEFLQTNRNVQKAVNRLIQCKSGSIQYNNRIARLSFAHMYLRTPTFIAKEDALLLQNTHQFIALSEYCEENGIEVTLTIAYFFWTLVDAIELTKLITRLNKRSTKNNSKNNNSKNKKYVTYQMDLEILEGYLYSINMDHIFHLYSHHCGDTIKTIVVSGVLDEFTIDLATMFPKLQNLWLHDCQRVKLVNLEASSLQKLALIGYNRNDHFCPINIYKLPQTLTHLQLQNTLLIANNNTNNDSDDTTDNEINTLPIFTAPPSLQVLSLDCCKFNNRKKNSDLKQQFVQQAIINKHSSDLTTFEYGANEFETASMVPTRFPFQIEKLDNLTSLKLHNLNLNDIFEVQLFEKLGKLEKLSLSSLEYTDILNKIKYPPSLKEIDLNNNTITDLSAIDANLPQSLQKLNLADNPIWWGTYTPRLTNFTQLKYLRLFNTHLGQSIETIQFPDSIEVLSLEVNQLQSIDQVRFPKNLVNLGIGSNKLTTVYKPHFPSTLKTLHLTENLLRKVDLSTNNRGQPLEIEILYLNYNRISKLSNLNLPQTLRILNLDSCKISEISGWQFSSTIEELSIMGCRLRIFENVSFGEDSQLKYICLSNNELRKLDNVRFPHSVETINLSSNNLSKIPTCLKSLQGLKVLNLSSNKLRSIVFKFDTPNLEVLDFSYNHIKKLQLSHWLKKYESRLVSINLSRNDLSIFNMEMIGHHIMEGKASCEVGHKNLVEIDLSLNNELQIDLDSLIPTLPPLLTCLMLESTVNNRNVHGGPMGYRFARSCLPRSVANGKKSLIYSKRIDYPSAT